MFCGITVQITSKTILIKKKTPKLCWAVFSGLFDKNVALSIANIIFDIYTVFFKMISLSFFRNKK